MKQLDPNQLRDVVLASLTAANAARADKGRSHTDGDALRELANNLTQILCLGYDVREIDEE